MRTAPDTTAIRLRLDGAVGRITLARPEKLNALNRAALEELALAAAWFDEQPTVKVVVLSGEVTPSPPLRPVLLDRVLGRPPQTHHAPPPGGAAGLRTVLGAPPGWCRASFAAESAGYAGRLGEDCPKPGTTPAVSCGTRAAAPPVGAPSSTGNGACRSWCSRVGRSTRTRRGPSGS